MKKLISILLAVLILFSLVSAVAYVSAETTEKIYFEKPAKWAGTIFYTHIFEATGDQDSFFGWQSKKEQLTEEDGKYVYDLSVLNDSRAQISGGLKENKDYTIIFSDNVGNETCGIMFNTNCIGDTARVVSESATFENVVDSTKHSYELGWTANSEKYGIPLTITSVGTVQGKFIPKDTTINDIINQWDNDYPDYPNVSSFSPQSSARNHNTRLNELREELPYRALNGEFLYVGGGVYQEPLTEIVVTVPTIRPHPHVFLEKEAGTVYLKGKMKIPCRVFEPYKKTTYTSSNTKVAKVNSNGVVTGLKAGKAVITIRNYNSSAKYTLTVKKPFLNKKSVSIKRGKKFTLKITGRVGRAKFSSSNKKIATVNSKGKITVKKKAKKGKTVTISVKTNGITLKCKVKVK